MTDHSIGGIRFNWYIILPTGEHAGRYRFKYQARRDLRWYYWMENIRKRETSIEVHHE